MRHTTTTILIADDDPDDRELMREAFAATPIAPAVRFVGDGEALLELVRRPEEVLPGLILLDLSMPRMAGHDVLVALKADPRLRHVPVVVMTTSKTRGDIARSYDLGASSFITKPVTFDELVAAASTLGTYWLELVELP